MASKHHANPESLGASAATPAGLIVDPAEVLDLHGAPLRVHAELSAPWISALLSDTDAHAEQPGQIDVAISAIGSGPELLARGSIHAGILVPCARCLADAKVDVGGEVTWRLIPKRQALASELARAMPRARPTADVVTTSPSERPTVGGKVVPGKAVAGKAAVGKNASAGPGKAAGRPPAKVPNVVAAHDSYDDDEGEELTSDDLDIGVYEDRVLDLGGLVGEIIKAGYPMRTLCEWGEACWGLCPACGLDLQRDDRIRPSVEAHGDRPRSCPQCKSTLAWPEEGTAILVSDGRSQHRGAKKGGAGDAAEARSGAAAAGSQSPGSSGAARSVPGSDPGLHGESGSDGAQGRAEDDIPSDDPRFAWREKLRRLRDGA